jgi:hypothetical protein
LAPCAATYWEYAEGSVRLGGLELFGDGAGVFGRTSTPAQVVTTKPSASSAAMGRSRKLTTIPVRERPPRVALPREMI